MTAQPLKHRVLRPFLYQFGTTYQHDAGHAGHARTVRVRALRHGPASSNVQRSRRTDKGLIGRVSRQCWEPLRRKGAGFPAGCKASRERGQTPRTGEHHRSGASSPFAWPLGALLRSSLATSIDDAGRGSGNCHVLPSPRRSRIGSSFPPHVDRDDERHEARASRRGFALEGPSSRRLGDEHCDDALRLLNRASRRGFAP